MDPLRAERIEARNDRYESLARVDPTFHVYGVDRSCGWCGGPCPAQTHQGQPREWCSESCRHRAYRASLKEKA